MRVLLLVGVYRADLVWDPDKVSVSVAGAVDHVVWDHETQTDTDKRWATMREAFEPHGDTQWEWREVWVELDDAQVREHFKAPVVVGAVEPPSDNQRRTGDEE